MQLFLGEYQPNITEGSRLALPKKMRDQIRGEELVLSRGFEKCISIYDREEWVKVYEKESADSTISDPKTRDLKRYMFGMAQETTIDSQGRIVLPANLRDYAGLTKETTIIGAGDHIEIWDTLVWLSHLEKISAELAG